jgi:hypothetical protein
MPFVRTPAAVSSVRASRATLGPEQAARMSMNVAWACTIAMQMRFAPIPSAVSHALAILDGKALEQVVWTLTSALETLTIVTRTLYAQTLRAVSSVRASRATLGPEQAARMSMNVAWACTIAMQMRFAPIPSAVSHALAILDGRALEQNAPRMTALVGTIVTSTPFVKIYRV